MTDFAKLVLDADTKGLKNAEKDLESVGRKAGKVANEVGGKMKSIGTKLTIGVTAPLALFGKASIDAAADAVELQGMFDTTFGNMSGAMNQWAIETGNAMGRSTQELQEASAIFQGFFKDSFDPKQAAEMSKTFTVLSQDVASFKNLSNDVAQQKIFSALTGETEGLKALGVVISDNVMKQKAMEMGLGNSTAKLTEQQKVMIRATLLQEKFADASGDVIRTQDSTANQVKKAEAAWEELKVTIGDKLLPIVTPLITGFGNLLDKFTQLPSGVQTTVVAFAAVAAVLGPILFIAGSLVSMGGTLFAFFTGAGAAATVAGAGAATGATGFLALSAAALPFIAIGAGIAAAGALIYANWDKIGPVLAGISENFNEVLGPKIQAMIETVKAKFTELWDGPLGDGIRKVIGFIGEFQAAYFSVLGEGLTRVLSAAIDIVGGAFSMMGDAISVIVKLLSGDFAGAWEAAKSYVSTAIDTVLNVINSLVPGTTDAVRAMYNAVKTWVVDKLGTVWNTVTDNVETVKNSFFNLYDAVVGHSYIPDMVDGIADNMARLDSVMVDKALKTTAATKQAFRQLASDVRGLLDSLYPDAAKMRAYRDDLGLIDRGQAAGLLDGDTAADARNRRMGQLRDNAGGRVDVGLKDPGSLVATDQWNERFKTLQGSLNKLAEGAKVQTVRIAKSFGDMAKDSLSALDGMIKSIKGGGFLDILQSALGLFTQLGSSGLFGKGVSSFLNAVPAYAGGTSFHPGGMALVGERGAELVDMPRGSRVHNATDTRSMMGSGRLQVEVVANNNGFGAMVRNEAGQVVASAVPTLTQASSQVTQRQLGRRQTRRIG